MPKINNRKSQRSERVHRKDYMRKHRNNVREFIPQDSLYENYIADQKIKEENQRQRKATLKEEQQKQKSNIELNKHKQRERQAAYQRRKNAKEAKANQQNKDKANQQDKDKLECPELQQQQEKGQKHKHQEHEADEQEIQSKIDLKKRKQRERQSACRQRKKMEHEELQKEKEKETKAKQRDKNRFENLKNEDVKAMTWEQKSYWLRSNPVSAARHFDHRLQLFVHEVLCSTANPIGKITDFKYRIEFQQRGSPHAHMIIWVKDAPTITEETKEDVQIFVDKYMTCALPPEDTDIKETVQTVQMHTHSVACRKSGKECRFGFPLPIIEKTTVFLPFESTPSEQVTKTYMDILHNVQTKISDIDAESSLVTTLDDILESLMIHKDMYMQALRWLKTKNGQSAVLLKRKPAENRINFYNSDLLSAWTANMDIQFVTNVYACVMYVASYMSKPEKTLGDLLKSVSKTSEPLGAKVKMQNIAKKFLSHREVSAQEAVYRLLSLPLTKGARQVQFVATNLPEDRTCLLKPLAVIQKMEDDDDDIRELNVAEGARVSLTCNMDQTDGLVNSAAGTVTGFYPNLKADDPTYKPKYILVKFDDDKCVLNTRIKMRNIVGTTASTPIKQVTVDVRKKQVTVHRTQFPLTLAWASTIHKAQGKTLDQLVVSNKGTYRSGQMYTALSRVKTLQGLYLIDGFSKGSIKVSEDVVSEMKRLTSKKLFKVIPSPISKLPEAFLKISVLNINSLIPHYDCLSSDDLIKNSNIVFLTETWLQRKDCQQSFEISSNFNVFRQDRIPSRPSVNPHGGLVIQVHHMFLVLHQFYVPITAFEHLALLLETRGSSDRVLVICIYNRSTSNPKVFLQQLNNLLASLPVHNVPTILSGDFNVNYLTENSIFKELRKVTSYHGFIQYIHQPTHRFGSALDHIYINREVEDSVLSATPVHFTDHFHVQMAIPFQQLFKTFSGY